MTFHTNQFGLRERHWNLETSSVLVEVPPLFLCIIINVGPTDGEDSDASFRLSLPPSWYFINLGQSADM